MARQVALWDVFPIYGYERQALIAKEKGCVTIPLQITLPEAFTLDANDYDTLHRLFITILTILGPNRLVHKQDLFFQENYTPISERLQGDILERANENYFTNRPFLVGTHYLYLSMVPENYIKFNPQRANAFLGKTREFFFTRPIPKEFLGSKDLTDFEAQVQEVNNLINSSGLMGSRILNYDDLFSSNGLYANYFGLSRQNLQLMDIDFNGNALHIGNKRGSFYTLENLDQFNKDHISTYEFYGKFTTQRHPFPIGNLFPLGFKIPHEHIINQYIYLPDQSKVLSGMRKKARNLNRFSNGRKDDRNTIYAEQIYDYTKSCIENHQGTVFYHLNVLGIEEIPLQQSDLHPNLSGAFKKLRIHPKHNTIDRKNLFFAGVAGNAIGISADMYVPMPLEMASSLLYFEGGYRDATRAVDGLKLVDRITGQPLSVSVYREPERKDWIFNRGMLVASGSGGGKSYFTNHYLASELRQGAEAIIMEDGNSYDRLTEVFGGIILQHQDADPFTFNPFVLDSYDFMEITDKGKVLVEGKRIYLITLLKLIMGTQENVGKPEVTNAVLEYLVTAYYHWMWQNNDSNFKFDTFFDFCASHLKPYVQSKNIPKDKFDPNVFIFLLEKYYGNNARGNLLNKVDNRISQLSDEKLVYFKLGKLIDNELLFPITALMIMEIFNKKMYDPSKLSINKILAVDEAWKALAKPALAHYFNSQSRMARKMGGQPIFISQKVDDFTASEIIKNAIVVNSHIKVFLDMRDFAQSFDKIQALLGLGEKQKQLILSLNKDLPKDRKYREVAFCWLDKVKVYGVETSLEEKCIYETNPKESDRIKLLHQKNNRHWELTAKAYAHEKSKKTIRT
ncbi:TraG family conjugative transposon ATPase [Arenibacter sp. 6A1]|uniref:TraG family conjugative transposon ATPase n=1 Tax=Arenibacter sp. 6A1 TaxID=2720391 RepID=UPI001446E6F3|nr:TraG family conjugative transposon ATPase [Arenibacter sp. 6A1]NKI27876.1 TraG family conjugative transposon ATPase [Arenibacter sp. 6A1]